MSKYFIDTEFYEDGKRIYPISMGVISDNYKEFYVEFRIGKKVELEVKRNKWMLDNVVRNLSWDPKDRILPTEGAELFLEYLGDDDEPEFWAYFADYDWIVLCQMFGRMIDLPEHFPKYCLDIKQYWHHIGKPRVKPPKPKKAHNALADAKWNLEYYNKLRNWYQTPI